jgi:phage terminase large subunit-like protein
MNPADIPPELREVMLKQVERELSRRKLDQYEPYPRQEEFHALGASKRERLFMAGNQLGKTVSGAAEMAMHLTGRYPSYWKGRVFKKPIAAWASGVTGESVRDTVQRLLMGRPGQIGTGFIPAECIVGDPKRAMGIADLLDSVTVMHESGSESRLYFKRYEQGREKWQGETLDVVWFDEEPPADIYTEGLTRTNATGGMAYMTFTPLLGMSEVVMRFLNEVSPDRAVVKMTIDDVTHYTEEEKKRIIAGYPPHEREARARGLPVLGSGRIFPIEEDAIKVAPFQIPAYWPRINGLDFGWDHPTAAVNCAWDRDNDCWYVVKAHRMREATPIMHAATIRPWGDWVPTAWPHDGLQHDKGSGEQLAVQYANAGLKMLAERATFDDGSNGVEAGLMDMLERMQTGRFKVFSNLDDWFQEFRLYHRKDGKVVKQLDDLMSASRYALMMKRKAKVKPSPKTETYNTWVALDPEIGL